MAIIDLSKLPAPNVIEALDYETVLADRKAKLLALVPAELQSQVEYVLSLETEPLTIALQESAYRELILRNRINEAARSVLLAYATDKDLDQIGANYGVYRLTVQAAIPDAIPPVAAILESDANFKKRIQLVPESYSTAGPVGGYVFHGLSASADVKDIAAISTLPGVVNVYVLSKSGNGTASQDLLGKVQASLNNEDVRPLTDQVIVSSATIVNFSINATIYVQNGPDRNIVLDAVNSAIQSLLNDTHMIGSRVSLSSIYAALQQPGVEYAALVSPTADIVTDSTHAPFCTGSTINMESA